MLYTQRCCGSEFGEGIEGMTCLFPGYLGPQSERHGDQGPLDDWELESSEGLLRMSGAWAGMASALELLARASMCHLSVWCSGLRVVGFYMVTSAPSTRIPSDEAETAPPFMTTSQAHGISSTYSVAQSS